MELDNFKYQAERALYLGTLYRPHDKFHLYNNLILENMLSYFREKEPELNYLHPALHKLEAYDKKNNTEYLKTLDQYITSMCNYSRTIEQMHIHRNTLHYRLKRIQEITDISLDDNRTCALLLINFYLLQLA